MKTNTETRSIPLSRPDIRDTDIKLVEEVLLSGMLVQGKYVEKLEASFAEYHNVKHAIAVSNGTATLHLSLKVLGIGEGDEVIVPALSYVATANVVELVGATPVFVDVDTRTFNIDVAQIESKITSRTRAIIPVHEFGLACDIQEVIRIAEKHNLHVIEDAACALGATQNDRLTGSFGILASFSLHPRKSITSGEGGVILTSDDQLAAKLRQLRNHGIEMDGSKMKFVEAGFNYRMTDFQGALAYSQFSRIDDIIAYKNQLAEKYFSSITADVLLPEVPADRKHTWQTFHLLLNGSVSQTEAITRLREAGIGANYGAQCIPAQDYYKAKYGLDYKGLFPNAYTAYTKGLAIPLYERMNEEDIQYVAEKVNLL